MSDMCFASFGVFIHVDVFKSSLARKFEGFLTASKSDFSPTFRLFYEDHFSRLLATSKHTKLVSGCMRVIGNESEGVFRRFRSSGISFWWAWAWWKLEFFFSDSGFWDFSRVVRGYQGL